MLFKKSVLAAAIVAAMGTANVALADRNHDDNLPVQDSFVKTVIDKSIISGEVLRDPATGMIKMDENGNVLFQYTGTVYSIDTEEDDGELEKLKEAIGTIEGVAAFPMAFAQGAIAMKAYMMGVGPAPQFPPVINWTCATCKMTIGDNVYQSIVDENLGFDAAAVEDMRLKGRAFTAFGPVEVGAISEQSMTVRLAGCSAVVGVEGPDSDKIGSLCMNSSLTFDLSGVIVTGNPMDSFFSTITGEGTSNCTTVLQPRMQ